MILSVISQRALLSLNTIPTTTAECSKVFGITMATTVCSGITAVSTGFIDYEEDWDPTPAIQHPLRPLSAFLFPSLLEEVFWRGALLPSPSISTSNIWPMAGLVLTVHVFSHPMIAYTGIWPRGKQIFEDRRFILLASIVLGGATSAYIVSGGSAWAAALTHGLPVALWRDFFGGEKKLSKQFVVGKDKGKG